MAHTDDAQHGLARSVVLHLAPGLIMLGFYVATAPWFVRRGFPPLMASLVSIPLILVPWMLGYLTFESKRRTGRYSVLEAVTYREPLRARQYLAFGLPIILWGALVFAVSDAAITPVLIERHFSGLPDWFVRSAEFDDIVRMPLSSAIIFLGSLLVFAGVVAPVVEELYFRGHLLPAVGRYGAWAPVLTVALFTLYHFESPWESPGRFLVVLPLAFMVWHKKSVAFGVAVHVALNTLSALALTYAVFSSRTG